MPAPERASDDLSLLIDAARAAGTVASGFALRGARHWDKPDGQGPVTEADLAVDALLKARLRTARPDYGWLSEETPDDPARLQHERIFIVDPIDGTRSFMQGSSSWAHSLAVAEGGQILCAVVFLPIKDRIYTAARGAGAAMNGRPIRCTPRDTPEGARMLAAKPNYDAPNWREGAVPGFDRHYRPSLAYRLSLVAQGRFDAMLTLRDTWEWDIAAGALIAEEAGARTTDRTGQPLAFNRPGAQLDGVLAAGPDLHAQILDRLAPR